MDLPGLPLEASIDRMVGFVELDGGTSWVVLARRGEEVIFAKAASQDEAWAKAFQMARPLDR